MTTNPCEMIKHHLSPVFTASEAQKIIATIGDWPEMCDRVVDAALAGNREKALYVLAEIGFSI